MKSKQLKIIAALFLLVITVSSCIGVDRSFRHISNYIVENTNSNYSKEYEFSIGSTGITLASLVVSFADTDEPIDEILNEISNVQVGIYSNQNSSKVTLDYAGLRKITDLMERAGWEYVVRTVDKDELTAVFVRIYEEQINRVFVISVNQEELVLVELYGNVDKVIEIAIREGDLDIERVSN
ncbi:MAG: DUF4252 domain-containing protein [Bacteroidota bacterium]